MSQVQTLAELVAQAEAEDNPTAVAAAEDDHEEEEEESLEAEPEDESEESDEEEDSKDDKPEWAKTPDPKLFVPAHVHADLRKSLRGEVENVSGQLAEARAKLAQYESGSQAASVPALKMPTLAECEFDDDVFAKKVSEYNEALFEQKMSERDKRSAAQNQNTQQQAEVNSRLDKHYERAEELITKGVITAENYKAAEMIFRKEVEATLNVPSSTIDYMIASLGDGSAAVTYHLGVNPEALARLKQEFKVDPNGLSAMAYLGRLANKFEAAAPNKPSNTPKPDRVLNGTAKIQPDNARKAYMKAEKSGDVSGMIAAEKVARGKGIDTSKW